MQITAGCPALDSRRRTTTASARSRRHEALPHKPSGFSTCTPLQHLSSVGATRYCLPQDLVAPARGMIAHRGPSPEIAEGTTSTTGNACTGPQLAAVIPIATRICSHVCDPGQSAYSPTADFKAHLESCT